MITWVEIKRVMPNPNNPRAIRDARFEKLKQSIIDFPEMLEKRPLVCYTEGEHYIVLGGNMRLKALSDIGAKEIPIILADEWTEEQRAQFLIKDNVGFGEWDWNALANEWDADKLTEWGLDVPIFEPEPSMEDLIGDAKNKPATMKITFSSPEDLQEAEIDIQELLDRKYPKSYFSVSFGEI
jgi:hypothetical protein